MKMLSNTNAPHSKRSSHPFFSSNIEHDHTNAHLPFQTQFWVKPRATAGISSDPILERNKSKNWALFPLANSERSIGKTTSVRQALLHVKHDNTHHRM